MEFFVIIIVLIVFINIARALSKKQKGESASSPLDSLKESFGSAERNNNWMKAAGDLKLSYVRPSGMFSRPGIAGRLGKFDIFVDIISAEDGTPLTTYRVNFPKSLDLGLLAAKDDSVVIQTMFSGRKKLKLFSDIAKFAIAGDNEEEIKNFLINLRRAAISEIMQLYPAVTITDQFMLVRVAGTEQSADRLVGTIQKLVAVADTFFSDHSATPAGVASLSNPTWEQVQPKISVPFSTLDQKAHMQIGKETEPLNSQTYQSPVQDIEPVFESDDVPSLSGSKVSKFEPKFEPKVMQKVTQKFEPASPIKKTTVGDPLPKDNNIPATSSLSVDLNNPQELASKLFSGGLQTAAEKDYFASIKGRAVTWEGTLKGVYEYRSDFVFGNQPGAKATLEVCEISGSYSMKSKVKAIVSFPSNAIETLRGQNNKVFRFSAKIVKVENFAKEIYLNEGSLL